MEPADIDRRIAQMREEFPIMFSHPDLRPGEIYIADRTFEGSRSVVMDCKQFGMPSARMATKATPGLTTVISDGVEKKMDVGGYYAVFVDAREYVLFERAKAEEEAKTGVGP